MFTGIVEELGIVRTAGKRFVVGSRTVASDSAPGASVAVSGVCLTVVERRVEADDEGSLAFELSDETLERSALPALVEGDAVNLERPLTLLTRLGGHLVQGHVDTVAKVTEVAEDRAGCLMRFELPAAVDRYVVEKGSIAVDGVSLTVTDIADGTFGVALVPYTLRATTLGRARAGTRVNLEVDVMAKYVERLLRRAG